MDCNESSDSDVPKSSKHVTRRRSQHGRKCQKESETFYVMSSDSELKSQNKRPKPKPNRLKRKKHLKTRDRKMTKRVYHSSENENSEDDIVWQYYKEGHPIEVRKVKQSLSSNRRKVQNPKSKLILSSSKLNNKQNIESSQESPTNDNDLSSQDSDSNLLISPHIKSVHKLDSKSINKPLITIEAECHKGAEINYSPSTTVKKKEMTKESTKTFITTPNSFLRSEQNLSLTADCMSQRQGKLQEMPKTTILKEADGQETTSKTNRESSACDGKCLQKTPKRSIRINLLSPSMPERHKTVSSPSTPKKMKKESTKTFITTPNSSFRSEQNLSLTADRMSQRQVKLQEMPKTTILKEADGQETTSKTNRESSACDGKSLQKTPKHSIRINLLSPSMPVRHETVSSPSTPLEAARARLHVSAVPKTLMCREVIFEKIHSFLEGRIEEKRGGSMYISGVPGTGKTATVRLVVSKLQMQASEKKLADFDFVELNGMRLTTPQQAYCQLLQALDGVKAMWSQAMKLLQDKFSKKQKKATIILVDELDLICNKRQDVIYNLLEWPRNPNSRLIVITIANTMDLPEKLLSGRVTSRMGINRIYFKPYLYSELEKIVTSRLVGIEAFEVDAVRLAAKKVASLSGDCRRALDICRRATEVAERQQEDNAPVLVTMTHIQQVIDEMMSSFKVQAIAGCGRYERLFLRALATSLDLGKEQVEFVDVYPNIRALCTLEGVRMITVSELLRICVKLSEMGIIIRQQSRNDIQQKIMLNCNADDIHWAVANNV